MAEAVKGPEGQSSPAMQQVNNPTTMRGKKPRVKNPAPSQFSGETPAQVLLE